MPSPKIEVREVWKKFHRGELHDSLRDLVPDLARRLVVPNALQHGVPQHGAVPLPVLHLDHERRPHPLCWPLTTQACLATG